jgi:penicillin-binding protein 2
MINNKQSLFTRRALILGAGKAILLSGLISRMLYLQLISHRKFTQLSEKNRIKIEIVPALRGSILDRNGNLLATNRSINILAFDKLSLHNKDNIYQAALKIGEILDYSPKESADLVNKLNELNIDDSIVIKEELSWEQLVKIKTYLYDLPGVNIEIGFNRFYPYSNLCSHLTGYMGTVSSKELAKISQKYANIKVGKNGIEKTQENFLHGQVGSNKLEVNAKGEIVRELSSLSSVVGKDVQLTIDVDLQSKADELLGNNTGVVLLANVPDGEILAAVSKPNFDPNIFNNAISNTSWNALINNPELPLIDRTVALTYPPGSGFKINVAIAALKDKFNPETRFFCPGHYVLGNRHFHCWNRSGHGSVNLHQAIASSCNVYFWNVAKIIGIKKIAETARMMGYGKKILNSVLPREQEGIIPDAEWKEKHIHSKWTMADTFNSAIGQGYVEATPMQILTMISRIATGKKIIPHLIKKDQKEEFAPLNLDKELSIIRSGMEMTVNSNIGTAFFHRIIDKDLAMAGKTGTSQVISKRYDGEDLSKASVTKQIRNHGVFISYAPIYNPKYVYCGIIEHGGTPTLAIKIAKNLLTFAQETYKE